MLCIITCLILLTVINSYSYQTNHLIQVHILFRHGDRERDRITNINGINSSIQFGELTEFGKERMLAVGRSLYEEYSTFNCEYTSQTLEARTTDFHRTKMSLLLVLAGLFPPSILNWNIMTDMNWQPIPYDYKPMNSDNEFFGITCKGFREQLKEYLKTPGASRIQSDINHSIQTLKRFNINVKSLEDIYLLYLNLRIEEEDNNVATMRLDTAPYFELIEKLALNVYNIYTATDSLQQYATGFMLKKILDDGHSIITKPQYNKKMILLSGHDLNVGMMLATLGIYYPHLPMYGASLIFELRLMNGVYGYLVYYINNVEQVPVLQRIPGCDFFCPYDDFVQLFKNILPSNTTRCN